MSDQWTTKAQAYTNCNCNFGCPCQFGAPSSHGSCKGIGNDIIDAGRYNDVDLSGVCFAAITKWPGEIAQGNGEWQLFVSDKATPEQRGAVIKISTGETNEPGTTHFSVFTSAVSTFNPVMDVPMEMEIDVDGRNGNIKITGILESAGSSLVNPVTGEDSRAGIYLPEGFEFTFAEVGRGSTTAKSDDMELTLSKSNGYFRFLHMNQSGVIRDPGQDDAWFPAWAVANPSPQGPGDMSPVRWPHVLLVAQLPRQNHQAA